MMGSGEWAMNLLGQCARTVEQSCQACAGPFVIQRFQRVALRNLCEPDRRPVTIHGPARYASARGESSVDRPERAGDVGRLR